MWLKPPKKVIWILLVLSAVPYVVYLVPQHLGLSAYIVDSSSMEPTIPDGSIVYEEWKPPEQLEEGDVIIFRPNSSLMDEEIVVHRIVEKKEGNYTPHFKTQGDANPNPDPGWLPGYRIVGEKIYHIPYLGYFILAGESTVFLLLVFIPAAIIVYSQATKIVENINRESKSNEKHRTPLYNDQKEN